MSEAATAVATAPTPAPAQQAADKPASAPLTEAGSKPTIQASESAKPEAASSEVFEIKVNGKTIKLTRDEALQYASLGHVSTQRFQEAAQMRKQAEAVIGKIRDPKQVISALQDPALGLSKDQIRAAFEEWYAREFIEPEKLTPEQKKLREYEDKIKQYAEAEKKRDEDKQKEEQETQTAQAREEVQKQIIEALETNKLPKTNFTMRRLAYWINRNNLNGFNAPTDVLVGQVRSEFQSSLRDMVEASDGEVLIQTLGDSIIQKIRKHDLEQLKKLRGQPQAQSQAESLQTPSERKAPLSSADVNERIRQLQRTGRF